jgi:tetratricopeptide (TPR) repeat protein
MGVLSQKLASSRADSSGADLAVDAMQPDAVRFFLGSAFLIVTICLAYLPAMHGGMVWDDDYMLTGNPVMTQPGGLWRILFDLHAVKVYYPVTEAVLWVECRFFGLRDLTGYHVVNTLIHAADSILLWRLLRQLRVPGAFAGAALFGLHPVQVESVAWITEHKNTLSLFFYLATMWALLRYRQIIGPVDKPPGRKWYVLAIASFVLALGAKTTVTTLPAAALLMIWWKTGRIRRGDVWLLSPLFLLSIVSGALTQWVEVHTTGKWNPAWSLTPVQQFLISGRALVFYLSKLIWPRSLSFAYPRWKADPSVAWQYVYPIGFLLLIAALWASRRKIGRGPLTGMLFFAGSLVPALGFFHVLYQRYSFVADHFQYIASIGPLALLAAMMSRAFSLLGKPIGERLFFMLIALVVLSLGVATARSSRRFVSDEGVWEQALTVDPLSPIANLNYSSDLIDDGRLTEAEIYAKRAIQVNPSGGLCWAGLGRIAEIHRQYGLAMQYYARAVELDPIDPRAHFQLANMLAISGQFAAAARQYIACEDVRPDWAEMHDNLGVCYLHLNRIDAAQKEFEEALRLSPDLPLAKKHLAEAATKRR